MVPLCAGGSLDGGYSTELCVRNRGLEVARLDFLAFSRFFGASPVEIEEIGGDFLFCLRNRRPNRLRIS